MPQALIYCRVSTEEQARQGYSLGAQERICREFADRHGFQVAAVFRDEGRSGTTMNRPALKQLLDRCENGPSIDAVIVQETDRLARNALHHLVIKDQLQELNTRVISAAQPMLDESPEGIMMDITFAGINQFYSHINSRKTKKGLQQKFDEGWWPGWAPLGYRNVAEGADTDARRARRIVARDPDRWDLLREGFKLYLTGNYSAEALCDLLYQQGLRAKNGKRISHSIMVATLKNPFYAGLMRWRGQTRKGNHEPMITLDEHRRILEIIEAHNQYSARRRRHAFLLRGFVFCNLCGKRYTAEVHPAKRKAYYHCGRLRGHSNRGQNVEVAELERQVEAQFERIQLSAAFINKVLGKLRVLARDHRTTVGTRKRVLLNQKKALEARRDRAEEKLLAGVMPDADFVRLRARFQTELDQIDQQLYALEQRRTCDIDVVQEMLHLLGDLPATYQTAPDELKRQLLGLFWEKFQVQDRRIVEAVPTRLIRALQAEAQVRIRAQLLRW